MRLTVIATGFEQKRDAAPVAKTESAAAPAASNVDDLEAFMNLFKK